MFRDPSDSVRQRRQRRRLQGALDDEGELRPELHPVGPLGGRLRIAPQGAQALDQATRSRGVDIHHEHTQLPKRLGGLNG